MDFGWSDKSDRLRAEVRTFLHDVLTSEMCERVHRYGVDFSPDFYALLHQQGWIAPGWPQANGGGGYDALEVLAIQEELQRAGAPTNGIVLTMLVANMVRIVGTEMQKSRILPGALAGEIAMSLGFTEPECGSDLAAVTTRAVPDGGGWMITGQKMFTTNAHLADYLLLLARSDPTLPKHKGLTVFLISMKSQGIDVQGVYTLSGERTNVVFLNEVRVLDEWRIGPINEGWSVMAECLKVEHSNSYAGDSERLLNSAEKWAETTSDDRGAVRIADRDVRTRLGRMATEVEVARLMQRRVAWLIANGQYPDTESSVAKLFSSEAIERQAQDLVDLIGSDGIRSRDDKNAPVGGAIEHALRSSLGTTIYAGTSEIQRTIIAQRMLGLPRH